MSYPRTMTLRDRLSDGQARKREKRLASVSHFLRLTAWKRIEWRRRAAKARRG